VPTASSRGLASPETGSKASEQSSVIVTAARCTETKARNSPCAGQSSRSLASPRTWNEGDRAAKRETYGSGMHQGQGAWQQKVARSAAA